MVTKIEFNKCDHVFTWKNLFIGDNRISKCIFCGEIQKHPEEF